MSVRFFARLTGREEVPAVRTDAFGKAAFVFNDDFTRLRFRLVVNDLEKFTVAHIHLGMKGQNGPVVTFLFGPVTRGISVNTGVITGTITKEDLVGPLEGMSLSELARQMRAGNTYVNAHTERHPNGEIRGQIRQVQ
jgi:CHRD domain